MNASSAATADGPVVEIAIPDDWHVHLRDDHMLSAVTPLTAQWFRHALVMPNLVPPIATTDAAVAYRQRILDAAGPDARPDFTPCMALYMTETVTIEDLRKGQESGEVMSVKYYPAGATTNSEHGGRGLAAFRPILEHMAGSGMPLLVHAEATDPELDVFDRERAFLDAELVPLVAELPELRVTVEHLSTAAGAAFVADHPQVKGSITPHHLRCDRTDLLANGLRPDLYCKPIINSPEDREALVAAATSGSDSYFLGTDSAPHPNTHKHTAVAKPGIFNAPFALPVVAEVFHHAGALDQLEAFTSINGCRHYGYPVATDRLRLTRTDLPDVAGEEPAAELVTADGAVVTIFGVAEARLWNVEPVTA
ncbi:MAG: dihydroorotase [Actinomycetota bacterium]